MSWEIGQRYRGRAVSGQTQVEKNAKTGTPSAVGLLEVTLGPNLGQRVRWRGYLNSSTNAETTIGELRAMGMRGARLGDWSGIGSKDVEFTLMADVSTVDGRTFYRAAFVRPLAVINEEKAVAAGDLDALNAALADVLGGPVRGGGPVPVVSVDASASEEIPF